MAATKLLYFEKRSQLFSYSFHSFHRLMVCLRNHLAKTQLTMGVLSRADDREWVGEILTGEKR